MKTFKIKNINDIPFESIHDVPNSRKTLVTKDELVSDNIEAMTKGILKPGQEWDWHKHSDHDEIGIVLEGNGKFYWEDQVASYKPEDVIIIPANSKHKFIAEGTVDNKFYFVRIKV
jgi:quercetin dioxygenase-like cupin family protein